MPAALASDVRFAGNFVTVGLFLCQKVHKSALFDTFLVVLGCFGHPTMGRYPWLKWSISGQAYWGLFQVFGHFSRSLRLAPQRPFLQAFQSACSTHFERPKMTKNGHFWALFSKRRPVPTPFLDGSPLRGHF